MQSHSRHLTLHHALLNSLLKQLAANAIPPIRFKHRNCHYVADVLPSFLVDVFLACDSPNKNVLYISKFAVSAHANEVVIKLLTVYDRQC